MLILLRPRYWAGHLALVAALGVTIALGLWQLDAWHARRADAARDLTNADPVALTSLMSGDSPFPGLSLGQPVSLKGTWTGANVYIADRWLDGQTGFWVVSAARVDDGPSAIPIVRGWAATPTAPAVSGAVEIIGWLQASEASGAVDQNPADDVLPTMTIASLVPRFAEDLYSGYVVQRSAVPAADAVGLRAVTPDAVPRVSRFTALRNLLYAIEWWVFGAFSVAIWVRWCRDVVEALGLRSGPRSDLGGVLGPDEGPDRESTPGAGATV